ncbi:hypothetical protein ACVWXR_002359 [Pseudomonas lurida]|uniref:sugar 3,4-ketoisomerase n=1 Tax=Pseudomonas lurida TaxID=244566 RepID=UPI001F51DD7D|nr:FdtA/QdtA family cupin domain-containing protein [Pseudomonas lurida]
MSTIINRTAEDVSGWFHAHRNSKKIAICLMEKLRMVPDNGLVREECWMENPTKGILIESMAWRKMHDFSDGCIFLVLASKHYDESDYIRNY